MIMSSSLIIQQMLQNIQTQVDAVARVAEQTGINVPRDPTTNAVVGAPVTPPDMQELVRNAVQAELLKLQQPQAKAPEVQQLPSPPVQPVSEVTPSVFPALQAPQAVAPTHAPAPTPAPTVTPQQASNGLASLLPIIGAAFTTDQQLWLSQPNRLAALPTFFMSQDGKGLLTHFLAVYQGYAQKNGF
jgi:hypothetical protein